MKRFWLVLLTLGLVMAFSTSVFAADVKFTGSFYAAGMYLDNTSFMGNGSEKPSTAFYYQRMRIKAEFIASPALKLVTQFDAMERMWGHVRSTVPLVTANDVDSYGTRAENENIAFDYAYVWYASKIGIWEVGIMEDGVWGTVFGDNSEPEGKIKYTFIKMPFIAGLQIVKFNEFSDNAVNASVYSDRDVDKYQGFFIFNWKGGQAGVLGIFINNRSMKPSFWPVVSSYTQQVYGALPYVKAKFGPVAVEAEAWYLTGKVMKWQDEFPAILLNDIDLSAWSVYVNAVADFNMFYFGGTFAYLSGDDPTTTDKIEGGAGTVNGGRDWNPCLIMFNWDRNYWAGAMAGYGVTADSGVMTNAYFGQLKAGVRPISDLDIALSVAYAKADKLPTGYFEKDYGWEVDVTATYKITNNLSYMLGAGYLFTGDYYEATRAVITDNVEDNFIVLNKLTLTF
mgnify:FL=1